MESKETYNPEEVMRIVRIYNNLVELTYSTNEREMRKVTLVGEHINDERDIREYLTIVPQNMKPIFIGEVERMLKEFNLEYRVRKMMEEIVK